MRKKLCVLFAALWLCLFTSAAAAEDSVNRALLVGCDRFVTQEDTTPSSGDSSGLYERNLVSVNTLVPVT